MAKSQFGTNSNADRKRVYYTETSTIYEGMPVCYEFDATTNVLGYDKGAGGDITCQTSPSTTAEGNQNEGKFLRVENPDADNIHAFAGVVAGSSYAGLTGPRWLDIYVPNGAIVPVRNDQNCTVGKTILAVHTGEQHLTAPFETGGRAVAIAWETKDTATATGLVLAKLDRNLFLYQKGDAVRLEVDDEDTGNMMVNQIIVGTSQASGLFSAFKIKSYVSAGDPGSWDYGLALDVSADIPAGTITNGFNGSGHWLNLGAGAISGGHMSALRAGIYEDSNFTFTSVASLAPLSLAVQVTKAAGSQFCMIYCRNNGAQALNAFIVLEDASAGLVTTSDAGASTHKMPIIIGGTTRYIMMSDG